MDRREFTLEVDDAKLADDASWRNLEEFGGRMREILVARGDRFDSARQALLVEFGVRVTATRTVFVNRS